MSAIRKTSPVIKGQIVEVKINDNQEVVDYFLNYPYFKNKTEKNAKILYAIYDYSRSILYAENGKIKFFNSSEKAEIYLLGRI